ncbi:MAG: hypothetical protein ABI690_19555 [Chloroflexota bacterium]
MDTLLDRVWALVQEFGVGEVQEILSLVAGEVEEIEARQRHELETDEAKLVGEDTDEL